MKKKIFLKVKYYFKGHIKSLVYVMEMLCEFLTFRFLDLITTLTYVLMDNFSPFLKIVLFYVYYDYLDKDIRLKSRNKRITQILPGLVISIVLSNLIVSVIGTYNYVYSSSIIYIQTRTKTSIDFNQDLEKKR